MKKLLLGILFSLPLLAQMGSGSPNCQFTYELTNRPTEQTDGVTNILVSGGAARTPQINNRNTLCNSWYMSVAVDGFSAVSLELDDAQNRYTTGGGTPVSWAAFEGTVNSGTNPTTSTGSSSLNVTGFYPWLSVNLASSTGTGSAYVTLYGWKSPTLLGSTSGSSTTAYPFSVTNYGASGMGDITTTVVGTLTSGSTTVPVASCSTFTSSGMYQQGVYIVGAGTAGALYTNFVSSCSGTTLVLTSPTITTVSNGAVVGHEDHVAINAAFAAAFNAGGGVVFFPHLSGGTHGIWNCYVLDTTIGGCIFPPQISATSVTSNTIGTGSQTFTVNSSSLPLVAGQSLVIYNSTANTENCNITSYSGTTLIVNCGSITGSGTFSSWTITNLAYVNVITVELKGENLGVVDQTTGLYIKFGDYIDCSLAPNVATIGTAAVTSCVTAAPYVAATNSNLTTIWYPINMVIDNIGILAPNKSNLFAVQLSNAMQANVGPYVYIVSKPDSANTWSQPSTSGTAGLTMSQYLNNIIETVDRVAIVGFNNGITPGEHTRLNQVTVQYTNYCLAFNPIEHIVSGELDCESSGNWIGSNKGTGLNNTIDLTMEGEVTPSGGAWWTRGATDILDTNNSLFGILRYSFFINVTGGYATVVKGGGANLLTCNLSTAPVVGVCVP